MNANDQRCLRFALRRTFVGAICLSFMASVCVAVESGGNKVPFEIYLSFRVEIDLYEGEAKAPQSQHLILFDSGVVYDIPVGQGSTISVFDIPRQRVVLLHKMSRVRSAIDTNTLVQLTAQVRAAAAAKGGGAALGLDAKVEQGKQPDSYVVQFGTTRYEVTSQLVTDSAIAAEFSSFTAWASRLNNACRMGSPPFARITLAEHLAAENRLPRQVKLEVRQLLKTRTFRSEHLVVERLSDLDRKKISDVGGMMATFQEVDFSEFPAD
jgi:hypothetical protein